MEITEKYILGLKKAYFDNEAKANWEYFENLKHGVANEDIEKIKSLYLDVPDALLNLLKFADGTYWREYKGEKITLFFLGSDLKEYPYYLLSAKEMIAHHNDALKYYFEYIAREYEEVDERITSQPESLKWLHFSDCMNNGGTSQLYIDFSPSSRGKKGQIVRFLHDPDEFSVIADSFEDYLQMLMDNKYDFIHTDVV